MNRFVFLLLFNLCQTLIFSQVKISQTASNPDPSAGLEVQFSDRGFLPPRLTSAQRDAILNPARGLTIYNLDTDCKNYFNGSTWRELCGSCVPLPIAAIAGPDQLNLLGSAATLAANTPPSGTGQWSVVSGSGGAFAAASSPTSSFSGVTGVVYTLRWTITTPCGSTSDDVSVSFCPPPAMANAGPDQTVSTILDTVFSSHFNSPPVAGMTLQGVASYINSIVQLTPATNGSTGVARVDNYPSAATNVGFEATFNYFIGGGDGADGIYMAFGPESDINGLINNNSGYGTPAYTNNLFQIRFLTYSAHLSRRAFYGGSQLGYSGSGPQRNVWTEMKIIISSTGVAQVLINNNSLFGNMQLPPAYVNAVKTNYKWMFTGVTGGLNDRHEIDNLVIKQTYRPNSVSLSANSPASGTGTWSVVSGPSSFSFSNVNDPQATFTGQSGGVYVLRWTVVNSCSTAMDEVTITL